jgi:deoxyribodipyrimidine photolyase
MVMTDLVWLHEDALRADHPVFAHAGLEAQACFIWDENYLKRMQYSFKRLVFIYESLCELPLDIYQGDTIDVLVTLTDEYNSNAVFVAQTPNPELKHLVQSLQRRLAVNVIADEPFITLNQQPELKRFYRYWNKVKKLAMRPVGKSDPTKELFK